MTDLLTEIAKRIPDIETSYALLAAMSLMIVVIAAWLFGKELSNRKERIFIYIILFFLTIVIALGAGFRTGVDTVEPEIVEVPQKPDPSTIKLPENTHQKIEQFLNAQDEPITSDSKVQVIDDAIEAYLSRNRDISANETALPSENEVDGQGQTLPVQASESKRGVDFEFNQCSRTDEKGIIICTFAVINKEEDITIDIVAGNSPKSRIVDSNGITYEASDIEIGAQKSPYVAKVPLVKDISIRGKLTFSGVADEIRTLSLLEINSALARPREQGFFPVQFRDIAL